MPLVQMEETFRERQASLARDWWRIGDAGVLLAYVGVVLWTIRYHEKWADEAQAWLIARDLDLRTIWFHELRYEGTPGLWHTILWVAQHVFHAGYGSIGYIGLAFAIAGVAVLLFLAPFPRLVRWPLAFTYVLLYQYAVIARPYTLLPLLTFSAAIFFKDLQHPERITIVLVLLALLTLHGTILAACLGLAYLVDAAHSWPELHAGLKKRYLICIVVMALIFLFVVLVVKPTPDVEEFATKQEIAQLAESLHLKQPTVEMKLVSVLSGAFLDYVSLSVIFILLTGAWCAMRRRLLLFSVPITILIVLYVAVHGYSHHHGTITIAALTAVWIAWPRPEEREVFSLTEKRATQGMVFLLLLFCGFQIWDSVGAIDHEYRFPYSGAEDAAAFLKSAGAEQRSIFGFMYGVAGIQAYFDHNIFANMRTSYFHHGVPLDGANLNLSEVQRVSPGYIVIFSEQPQLMMDCGVLNDLAPLGYKMVHFSDGYMLYKWGVYVRQAYFIFSRDGLQPGSLPLNPGAGSAEGRIGKGEIQGNPPR